MAKGWNEVVWNEVVMERSNRVPFRIGFASFHRKVWRGILDKNVIGSYRIALYSVML